MPELGNDRSMQLSDILLGEQTQIKKIIAAMGFRGGDIDDVLQDVTVEALNCAVGYDGYDAAKLVLCRITINVCNKERRRQYRFRWAMQKIFALLPGAHLSPPIEEIIQREDISITRTALEKMDDKLKTVLVLRYFCDLNSVQIGEVLKISDSTVRSRLADARMALAVAIKDRHKL